MKKREISNLDLKIKITNEYLNNDGIQEINNPELLTHLMEVKVGSDGKTDPESVSTLVNAFMLALLASHLKPPVYHSDFISEYASTLQKDNSFTQTNIDTKEQFDKVYADYSASKNMLFRGQREAKWRLYSKLQRLWLKERLFEKDDYESFISRMVELGAQQFSPHIKELLQTDHIDAVNSISILGYLQHHSCPTPLLDWTYSFQNALYFAIDGLQLNKSTKEIEDYCSVYFIDEKGFEKASLRTIIEESLKKVEKIKRKELILRISNGNNEKKKAMEKHFYNQNIFDRSKLVGSGLIFHMTKIENLIKLPITYFSDTDRDSGIVFSLNNSKNILNQAGVFTWNADASKPLELAGDEQYQESEPKGPTKEYNFCSCLNIHKSLVDYIRKKIESDGITRDFIYPTPEINTWEIFEACKK